MYRTLPESSDDVLGYVISGELDDREVEQMQAEISAAMERHGSVSLLLRIDGLEEAEPAAVWQDLKMTPEYVRNVDRAAVVGDQRWHAWAAKLGDAFADVRHFPPQHEGEAWDWVREGS